MSTAIFTIVRNEQDFLPLWLRYYSHSFHHQDMYVIDHESDDGSTDNISVTVYRESYPTSDNAQWQLNVARKYQTSFFSLGYQQVIYTDVDEFLVPDPEHYRDLREYLSLTTQPCITATGYVVCQSVSDPPIDLHSPLPILRQRQHWRRDGTYFDKPLIGRVPLDWSLGMHHLESSKPNPDPYLLLIHLHYMDRELQWRRLQRRMHDRSPDPGPWSGQNKFKDRQLFDKDFDANTSAYTPIPGKYLDVL